MEKMKKRYKIAIDYFSWSYRLIDIIDKKFIYIKCYRFKKIMFIYTYLLFSLMRDTKEYKVNSLQEVIEKLYSYDYTLLKKNIIDKGNKFNIFRTSLKLMKAFYRGDITEILTFLQNIPWVPNASKNINNNIVLLLKLFGIEIDSMLTYNLTFGSKFSEDTIKICYSSIALNEFGLPSIFFVNEEKWDFKIKEQDNGKS